MATSTERGGNEDVTEGSFIDSSRLDLGRYARRTALAMVLGDYLIYVERSMRRVSAECEGGRCSSSGSPCRESRDRVHLAEHTSRHLVFPHSDYFPNERRV